MNNFNFLKEYQKLQHGIMFDKIVNLGFAFIGYCKIDKPAFWNVALANRLLSNEEVSKVEETFKSLGYKSTIYFENRKDLQAFVIFLKEKGYKKEYEDSWMFWQDKDIDKRYFSAAKKVTTEKELKIFLRTFNACYQKMILKMLMEN